MSIVTMDALLCVVMPSYLDFRQQLGLLPFREKIVVASRFRCNNQMSSCRIKEHLVDLAL